MDAHDSVTAKVAQIFTELAGARAEALRGDKSPEMQMNLLSKALASDRDAGVANDIAFHLLDWNSDAAFLVAFLLFPERFSAEELGVAADMLLLHVPAHVLAA